MLLIYYANRAEKSILDPIIKELKNQNIEFLYEDLSTHVKNIEDDKNLSKVYDFVYNQIIDLKNKIKGSIVIGDRREIMFATMALFVKDIPVYQLAAGDLSEKISLVDDYFRHLITIISKKQVCFTRQSLKNSNKLRGLLNLETKSQFLPNPTLSDINLNDLKKKYSEPYDLILMHPQSLSVDNTISDSKITKLYFNKNKKTIIIKGNKDKNYEILYQLWNELSKSKNVKLFDNLKKDKFINLLANCDRFITNSSCSFYEAPLFLKKENIIHVGNRNKNREIASYDIKDMKSSKKIVNFIKEV